MNNANNTGDRTTKWKYFYKKKPNLIKLFERLDLVVIGGKRIKTK